MFGLRIVGKLEMALLNATISDLRSQISDLQKQVVHERERAEGAINALLLRTQKLVLTPPSAEMTLDQEENLKATIMDIFGDNDESSKDEEEILERIQSDATK